VKQHGYKGAKELAPFGKPSLLQQMAILIWVRLDIRQEGRNRENRAAPGSLERL
jgi:hypothetical protein